MNQTQDDCFSGDSNGNGEITDSYTIRLTKIPTGDVEIPLVSDGQTVVSGARVQPADATHLYPYVVFDETNWNQAVTIDVAANQTLLLLAAHSDICLLIAYRVDHARADRVPCGQGGTSRDISTAIMLPSEDPTPPIGVVDATDETQQTDTLLVFNDASVSEDTLEVTSTNISGIGMGSTPTVIQGEKGRPRYDHSRWDQFHSLEVVEIIAG